ncbi:hypothetical protein FQR65_LT09586 [Abscondita terminalis]|nr:hypothetical protein FQR65_LT09586 [Abscondita terminalis]
MADASESERDFIMPLITLYRDSPELWKVKSKDYFNQAKKQMAMKKIVDTLISFKQDFTTTKLLKVQSGLEASTDDIPKSKAWYYEEMLFIKDQLEIAQTDSSETETYFKKPEIELDIIPADQRKFAEEIINDTLFEAEMGNLTGCGALFISSNNSFVQYSNPPLQSQSPMWRSSCSSPSYGSTNLSPATSPAMHEPHNAAQTYIQAVPQAETSMNAYQMDHISEHSHCSLNPQQQQQISTAAEYLSTSTFTSF